MTAPALQVPFFEMYAEMVNVKGRCEKNVCKTRFHGLLSGIDTLGAFLLSYAIQFPG